ncbi:MAG: DUF5793 family protein [Halodesulfurarchaeum sp.]
MLEVTNVDWIDTGESPARPALSFQYTESPTHLEELVKSPDSTVLKPDSTVQDGEEVDVTFRFQAPVSTPDTHGVLALSNNGTGDFILEVETPATPIQNLIVAVRRYADGTEHETRYTVRLHVEEESVLTFEKELLLVYDPDGTLLRNHSLIPSGIEI